MRRLVVMLLAVLLVYGCSNGPRQPKRADAHWFCKQEVKSRLKSPESLKFPSITKLTFIEDVVTDTSARKEIRYTLSGHYTARNGFGGTVRSPFTCIATGRTGDLWRLDSMKNELLKLDNKPVEIKAAGRPLKLSEGNVLIDIPSDPGSLYNVLGDIEPGEVSGTRYVVTRRMGKGPISYSRRLVNCENQTYRYVGNANTLEETLEQDKPGEMSGVVNQSISWYVVQYACAQAL